MAIILRSRSKVSASPGGCEYECRNRHPAVEVRPVTQQSHLVCLGRRVNGVFTERDGMMGTAFAPSPVFGGLDPPV
jgi:hypothetical protein